MRRPRIFSRGPWAGLLLGFLALSALDSSAQEIQYDEGTLRILSAARQEEAKGNLSGAISFYEKALAEAKPDAKAGLRLELARFLDRGASAPGADPKWLERSRKEFQELISSSSGTARVQAANSFAAQLLRREQPAEAVRVLSIAVQDDAWKDLHGPARARCLFNLARALEATGRKREAYGHYVAAAEADPGFHRAADGARGVALGSDSEDTGIPQIRRLVDGQLERGDLEGAARSLRDALTSVARWQGHPAYPRLVEDLVRYFTRANVDRQGYARDWSAPLEAIPRDRVRERVDRMLATIDDAYADELPVEFASEKVEARYASWAPGNPRGLFSTFLAAVAAQSYRRGELRRALGAYSHAWALDTTNMEAALYAANILLIDLDAREKRLDPDGSLLKQLVDQLFSEKGAEYSREVGQDWNRLLKFHRILATIFEKQGRWGGEDDARSAVFQWRMALGAVDRLRITDPGAAMLAPPLHEGLARAYEGVGQEKKAFVSELEAAKEFVGTAGGDAARLEAAERALARAALLAITRRTGEESFEEIRNLHRTIEETRKQGAR
jgi:hypothetical protein